MSTLGIRLVAKKVRLKDIINKHIDGHKKNKDTGDCIPEDVMRILDDAILRANKICTHMYQFMRLWLLTMDDIPEITIDMLHMCFRAITAAVNCGRKPVGSNGIMLDTFNKFYDNTYSKLNYKDKISGKNLNAISDYMFTQMKTAIDNNIKTHYTDHVRRFINVCVKEIQTDYYGEQKIEKDQIYDELRKVKNDIFNYTLESPEQYHDWITEHRTHIYPKDFDSDDLAVNPQSYLSYLIYMSRTLERMEKKTFQFFPLRKTHIPSYITLDTKALVELFSASKGADLKNIMNNEKKIWGRTFKLERPEFTRKKYMFNYMLSTNGYATSLIFIAAEDRDKNNIRKTARVSAATHAKEIYKDMTQEEKEQCKKDRAKEASKKSIAARKQKKKEGPPQIQREFNYLEDLPEETRTEIREHPWAVVDLGKIRPLYIRKSDGSYFVYTRKEYIHQTKRLIYQDFLRQFKYPEIEQLETLLSDCRSKSCNVEVFKNYIMTKNTVAEQLDVHYKYEVFRQYQWYGYINKTRTVDKLVDKVKKFMGPDENATLLFGNWSANKNMKHMISTPGIGLKRAIARKIKSYDIDEFRTSALNCKTEDRNKTLYLKDINGESQKIHSVLTYKMKDGRTGCINRDKNAVCNMDKIVKSIFETGNYPFNFRRSTKKEEIKPLTNPQWRSVNREHAVPVFYGVVDGAGH